ncbi:MAG: excinuclease subunit [Bradyrhizobium sp.]|nr:excinuclease subunit [Bradyrhizobium sp.]
MNSTPTVWTQFAPGILAETRRFRPTRPRACPRCHGLGRVYEVTERSMVPDDSKSIRERAIAARPPAWHGGNLRDMLVSLGYDVHRPWRELPKTTAAAWWRSARLPR